jgi:hypothetical protein
MTLCKYAQNKAKQESNQATLARVKKEMDEPRMTESARKKTVNQTHAAGIGKAHPTE